MSEPQTRRVPANWSMAALHRAGAESISEVRENGTLVGLDVRPPITDTAYEAAAQQMASTDLDKAKTSLKSSIDDEAERQRQRWITPGAGQAMTYARKVEQARAVLAAEDPQLADYPMLAASIGIDGADLSAVATTILAMDAAWEQIGAAIEQVRLSAKQSVDLAGTIAAVEAVTVTWPGQES